MNEPRYPYREQHEFEPLGQILGRVLRAGVLGKRHVLAQVAIMWPEVAGEKAAVHSRPSRLEKGRLVIEVDSAVWHHHLSFLREQITEELNTKLERKLVKEVDFRMAGGAGKRRRKF